MNPQIFKSFSSLIPSYILKITKFLGEISQFEFLVMTEKNIFSYKLFLSLKISTFQILFFLCENCTTTPWKKSPPLKVEALSNPTFWKFGWRFNPTQQKDKRGGCTLVLIHIHGLTVYVKEGLLFPWDLSLDNSADSYLCFRLALLHSVSYFFFFYQSPSSALCMVFDSISSNIDEVLSINPSANVFVFGDFKVHHKDWLT